MKYFILTFIIFITFLSACRDKSVEPFGDSEDRGSIVLSTNPEGSRIYLDGVYLNKITPDSVTNLVAGIYRIRLVFLDLVDTTFQVSLQEGGKLEYEVNWNERITYDNNYSSGNEE